MRQLRADQLLVDAVASVETQAEKLKTNTPSLLVLHQTPHSPGLPQHRQPLMHGGKMGHLKRRLPRQVD
jgi:hypothetical protein